MESIWTTTDWLRFPGQETLRWGSPRTPTGLFDSTRSAGNKWGVLHFLLVLCVSVSLPKIARFAILMMLFWMLFHCESMYRWVCQVIGTDVWYVSPDSSLDKSSCCWSEFFRFPLISFDLCPRPAVDSKFNVERLWPLAMLSWNGARPCGLWRWLQFFLAIFKASWTSANGEQIIRKANNGRRAPRKELPDNPVALHFWLINHRF